MYNAFAGFGEETTWGTAVGRSEFSRIYEGSAINHNMDHTMIAYMGERDHAYKFNNAAFGSASIQVPFVYDGLDVLLTHCVGQDATKSGTGSPTWTYDYTLASGDTYGTGLLIGLSTEVHMDMPDAEESWLLRGGRVSSFGCSFERNSEVILTVDMLGQQVEQVAESVSPAYPDYASDIIIPEQVTVTIDGGSYTVLGFDFTVDNALEQSRAALGSTYMEPPTCVGKRTITGNIQLEWTTSPSAKTLYDKFVSGSKASISCSATDGANNTTTILLDEVFFQGNTPALREGEIIDFELPFVALDDATHGALKITQVHETNIT